MAAQPGQSQTCEAGTLGLVYKCLTRADRMLLKILVRIQYESLS